MRKSFEGDAGARTLRAEEAHRSHERAPADRRSAAADRACRDSRDRAEAAGRVRRRHYGSLPEERRVLIQRYNFVDWARKVVGVGSVGTNCNVLLLMGDSDEDPLFLQIKEARASVLEPYAGKSRYANQGQRIVRGQQFIQAASDIFLGWIHVGGRDFYVRQLRDMKGSVRRRSHDAPDLTLYGQAVRLGAGPRTRPHGRAGRHRRLPRQRQTYSTSRRRASRRPTRTRPSATMPRWSRRPAKDDWRPSAESERRASKVMSGTGGQPYSRRSGTGHHAARARAATVAAEGAAGRHRPGRNRSDRAACAWPRRGPRKARGREP